VEEEELALRFSVRCCFQYTALFPTQRATVPRLFPSFSLVAAVGKKKSLLVAFCSSLFASSACSSSTVDLSLFKRATPALPSPHNGGAAHFRRHRGAQPSSLAASPSLSRLSFFSSFSHHYETAAAPLAVPPFTASSSLRQQKP
jgi:hypothetical protein